MTPEQRLDRAEYILGRIVMIGREARSEFRQKINILIDAQIKNEAAWRAESKAINEQIQATNQQIQATSEQIQATNEQIQATNEQIKSLAVTQAELSKSQKRTDLALRSFINSLRKRGNGGS
jgi:predicted  nucleic acid-binding Zn-ribbon protein